MNKVQLTSMSMLFPRKQTPDLIAETVGHGKFDLARETPEKMTLVCFYRGLHCPICARYLKDLEKRTPAFAERGVGTFAISSDNEERARKMASKIGASQLRIGYGLSLSGARSWGLYISSSRGMTSVGIEEPERFSEPGLFLIRPDQTIYWLSIQSMPFVRPNFAEITDALDYVVKHDYPARGEYEGAL